ncbi:MAG: Hvo_1808 family surface protein [Haloarculaceae archaeon]
MRTLPALALALALVLAGCSTGFQGSPAPESTPQPTGTDAPVDTPEPSTPTPTGTGTDDASAFSFDFADPPEDRLGWEAGVWYNESLDIAPEDGLNSTELNLTVARAMARVEVVREEEFTETVPVTVIDRETYRREFAGGDANYTAAFRAFDNTKFEALFLIGEDRGALAVQNRNRGSSVLGFYSPTEDEIVVVSESENPTLNTEFTLAHELVHALQDQNFDLTSYRAPTRDAYNGQSGLIEGEANLVEDRYRERCTAEWDCLSVSTAGDGEGGDLHLGVYFVNFFPYSEGPGFVESRYRQGGWAAVDELYANVPSSAEQIIHTERYGADEPVNVSLADTNSGGWERVRPDPPRPDSLRPAYATLGQSALSSMFAYTLYDDYNDSRVVSPREWLNVDADGNVNSSDPLNYGLSVTDGWDGDRLHVYTNPEAGANETAYVWRVVWDSPAEAEEFLEGYRQLLAHWGGDRVSGSPNHWRIDSGPFEDSFYIDVEGDAVTIVNAPSEGDLGEVYDGYTPPS